MTFGLLTYSRPARTFTWKTVGLAMDKVLLAEGESRWTMAKPSAIAKVSNLGESQPNEFLAEYPGAASPLGAFKRVGATNRRSR